MFRQSVADSFNEEKTLIAGEPQSGAGQRLRRGQSGEKATVARHVRSARAADVQHRFVAVPDGVPVGVGSAVRRRKADRVGRRGYGKVEVETQGEQQQCHRRCHQQQQQQQCRQRFEEGRYSDSDVDGPVTVVLASIDAVRSGQAARRDHGASGHRRRPVQLAVLVAGVGQRP